MVVPLKSMWIQAIKNDYFTTKPILTDNLSKTRLPENSPEKSKGHMYQCHNNVKSTNMKENVGVGDKTGYATYTLCVFH